MKEFGHTVETHPLDIEISVKTDGRPLSTVFINKKYQDRPDVWARAFERLLNQIFVEQSLAIPRIAVLGTTIDDSTKTLSLKVDDKEVVFIYLH